MKHSYADKYIKYKSLYIHLKNQIGSATTSATTSATSTTPGVDGDSVRWGFGIEQETPVLIKLTPADITDLKRICVASKEHLNPANWVLYDDYQACLVNLQNIKSGTDCYVEFSVFDCLQKNEYLPLSEKIKSFTNDHLLNSKKLNSKNTTYPKLSRLIFICLVFYNQIQDRHDTKENAPADYTHVSPSDAMPGK